MGTQVAPPPGLQGIVPLKILKQVILLLESIQLLMVKSYPFPLCRVPPTCHLPFIFTANTLITSHIDTMNRPALLLSLLCVTNFTGSLLCTNEIHDRLAVLCHV